VGVVVGIKVGTVLSRIPRAGPPHGHALAQGGRPPASGRRRYRGMRWETMTG
jgi:hypothetical protein